MEALGFHKKTTLCHINGIFLNDILDVYIQAGGRDQLEYLGFVASYFSGEINNLIVAHTYLLNLLHLFGIIATEVIDLGPDFVSVGQDFDVLDVAELQEYTCQHHLDALQWGGPRSDHRFQE